MKKINKSTIPKELLEYIEKFPKNHEKHTWNCFCEDVNMKSAVQKQLKIDQRGICAYCEIDLLEVEGIQYTGDGIRIKSDFRVEHFHPKKADRVDNSWELEWTNLLAVCTGGDERFVSDTRRFSKLKSDRHCDSKKKNNIYDDLILNPLIDIPAFPNLWKIDQYSQEGRIALEPDVAACNECGESCLKKAQNTLFRLNLNCSKLMEFRAAAIDELEKTVFEEIQDGATYEEAFECVVKRVFSNATNSWPPFFSTVRAYFGGFAEARLHEIGYIG